MSQKHTDLVIKYALIVAIAASAEFFLFNYLQEYLSAFLFESFATENAVMMRLINFGFSFLLTGITLFFIDQDRRRLGISTRYVFLTTILLRPIGVFAFLIYAFMTKSESDTPVIDIITPEKEDTL